MASSKRTSAAPCAPPSARGTWVLPPAAGRAGICAEKPWRSIGANRGMGKRRVERRGGDVVVLPWRRSPPIRLGCCLSCCRAANQGVALSQGRTCTSENFSRARSLSFPQKPRYRRNAPSGMCWRSDGPSAGVMSVVLGYEVPRGKARS